MMDGSNNSQRQSAPQKCEKLWRRDSMGEGGDERIRCNRSVGPHLLGFGFPSPNSWSIAMSDTREWGDCKHGIRLYRCSLCRDEEAMTDTTKPPERVWAVRLRDGSWRLTKYHDPATVHATYTLASSLPGSVEEIEELYLCARAIAQHQHDNHGGLMKDLRRALAAMKKEQP